MQVATLRAKYAALAPVFTERSRRVWAAAEAQAIGYGGIALVARATGMAESTIQRGMRGLQVRHPLPPARSRRAVADASERPSPTRSTWRKLLDHGARQVDAA